MTTTIRIAFATGRALWPATDVRVVPVMVKAGTPSGGEVTAQAPGWIEPDPFHTDVSVLADGVVAEMLVLEGQRLEAGQVVARLVDDDARLALERAEATVKEINQLRRDWGDEKVRLEEQLNNDVGQLEDLRQGTLLTENRYQELSQKFGQVFQAGMGAEAILQILKSVNLDEMHSNLTQEIRTTSGQRRKKSSKQLQVVEAFRRSGNKPEWMILTVLPVLPPDLRPMVQLGQR